MTTLALAFRMARRELRGGLKGWRVFLACLALGVAAIAAIGALSEAVQEGIRSDGKIILGGDVAFRTVHRPAKSEQRGYLESAGTVSTSIEMRAMARAADGPIGARTLVELKTVDGAYPLYGDITLKPKQPIQGALAMRDGVPGAVVGSDLLERLKLKIGDRIRIGDASFAIRAAIDSEPDRGGRVFILGPRVIISAEALAATGLIQPGSLIYYHYKLKLPAGTNLNGWVEGVRTRFPDAAWQIRDASGAAPGMRRTVARVTLYMTFVGLTALLIGGVGIANAVGAYLGGRRETIATLKCLGASGRLIFATYLIQVSAIAALGIAIGLVIGAAAPYLLAGVVAQEFPVPVRTGIYLGPLVFAAVYGALAALTFSIWPLARAREIQAAALFRDVVARTHSRPRWFFVLVTTALLLAIAGLAIWSAPSRYLATWYVLAAAGSFLAFRLAGRLLAIVAARAGKAAQASGSAPRLRLALANLHRPGSPAPSVVLSLGLGLTVLVAIGLIEGNITNQIRNRMPAAAPTFFFIDIQSTQIAQFDAALKSVGGVEKVVRMPTLRARIVKIGGVPVRQARVGPGARWAVSNERGLTYAKTPPAGTEIVAGKWWDPDYSGPPLISFDARIAEGMGIGVGDTLTFNILGREITAKIANLREIDWQTLGMNFTVIFAPGTLEKAPHTFIATVRTAPGAEAAVMSAVTSRFGNVSAVRVKDALDTIGQMLRRLGGAVRATGAITILAGLLVLAGAVAAGHRRRVYDSVVLKVLGARRRDMLRAYLMEFGLLGLATVGIAAVIGTGAAWAVITRIMHADWTFLPAPVLVTIAAATLATMIFGYVGVWRALGRKPAEFLRND